jgi:twinkle protein
MRGEDLVYADPGVLNEQGQPIVITRRDLLPLILTPSDLVRGTQRLYEQGLPPGCSTGWPSVDAHYTVAPGQWTLVTGIPGHGKSEFLDALMVNLATRYGWRFAVYSPENSPQEVHLAKLLEKLVGKPFGPGPTERMTPDELAAGVGRLEANFGFIRPSGDQPANVSEILDECYTWVSLERERPAGVVLDPWNELEHQRPQRLSETEYISDALSRIRRFARTTNCHVWIVAHPRILQRDKTGKRPIPTPYDVSGSAHWYNKADNCLTVWRDVAADDRIVHLHVQKVRFKHIGKVGVVELRYDRVNGRYSEVTSAYARRRRQAPNGGE